MARKLQGGGSSSDSWQSSYVPTPAPTPPTPAAPMSGVETDTGEDDDQGGSSPDEALADQAEEPHPVTTPDNPAEVVSIDEDDTDDKA